MNIKTLIIFIIFFTLTGCATQAQMEAAERDKKTSEWLATLPEPGADYGTYPENYQVKIKEYDTFNLKDPDSAKYSRFSKPRKEQVIEKLKVIYGYSSCVYVNAKNSYGAYSGNTLYWYFFRNGKIIRSQKTYDSYGSTIYIGHQTNCQDG